MDRLTEIGRELWRELGGNGDEERAVAGWAGTVRALRGARELEEPSVQRLHSGYMLATGIKVSGLCSCHMLPARLSLSIAYSDREVTPELLIWTVKQVASPLIDPFLFAEKVAEALEAIAPNLLVFVDGSIPCTDPPGDNVSIRDVAKRGRFCQEDELRLEVWRAVIYREL